jgi:hypothetical protein
MTHYQGEVTKFSKFTFKVGPKKEIRRETLCEHCIKIAQANQMCDFCF